MSAKAQKQHIVGLKELRENMEKYVREVEKGKSYTVFRRSVPLFRLSPVDAEESAWETVADFTKVHADGVSAREILASLKKLHG